MSDNQIASQDNGPSDKAVGYTVEVGEENVNIQAVQELYRQFSGKPVKTTKSYSDSFRITFDEIQHLYFAIEHAIKSYKVASKNFDASIFYVDDKHDDFPSFDELKLRSSSSPSAAESLILRFKFLLIGSETNKTQNYSITIRLASRVAIQKRLHANSFGAPPQIIRLMGDRTAMFEIEYVDYMIARNLLSVFDEWTRTAPKETRSDLLDKIQMNTHWIPRFSKLFTVFVASLVIYIEIPTYVAYPVDFIVLSRFFVCAFCLLYAACSASVWLARLMEGAIDGMSQLSYLDLTKGDKIEIKSAQDDNNLRKIKSFIFGICSLISSVAVKIIASFVAKMIM